jgi:hypothetical protein
MFSQMEVTGAQKAPVKVEKIQYLIKGHDMNIPFSSDDGYDDKGAIARAQGVSDAPGLILYKKVGKEPVTVLYEPGKPKKLKKK